MGGYVGLGGDTTATTSGSGPARDGPEWVPVGLGDQRSCRIRGWPPRSPKRQDATLGARFSYRQRMVDRQQTLSTDWPVGPEIPPDSPRSWVAFKLDSATWYIGRLEEVATLMGFARFFGIEMALDGALATLCGSFDAAVGSLNDAVEKYFAQPRPGEAASPLSTINGARRSNWTTCKEKRLGPFLSETGWDISPLVQTVDVAIQRQQTPPGWLAELQELRNRAVHQDTLSRHIDATMHDETVWSISVGDPGRPEQPVVYLRDCHRHLKDLTDLILELVERICPNGIPTRRGDSVTVHAPVATLTWQGLPAASQSDPGSS